MERTPDVNHQPVSPLEDRRRILITGATRGIGRALAAELSRDYAVVIGGRDAGQAEQVRAEVSGAGVFVADLSSADQTEAAATRLDPVDVVIHCAGVAPHPDGSVRERWRHVLEINVVAVVHLTELLLPQLRERGGHIVFINSGSGLRAMGDTGGYSASKFALTSYAEGLREAERGQVRVSSFHPGRVDTDMQRDLQARQGRPYRAEEHMDPRSVALAVRAIVDSPADAVIESMSIRPN